MILMNERTLTLFDSRPEVGGERLHPLTGGRVAILEERGNPLVAGLKEGEVVQSWAVYETLMVAALEDEELLDVCVLDDAGWKREVRRYALGVEDGVLSEFWVILEAELRAIRAAQVETVKKKASRGAPTSKKRVTRRTGG